MASGQKRTPNQFTLIRAPEDLSPHLKGLCGRVARRLRVDTAYVSRVAQGKYYSKQVEEELEHELYRVLERANNRRGVARKASSRKSYRHQENKGKAERSRNRRTASI